MASSSQINAISKPAKSIMPTQPSPTTTTTRSTTPRATIENIISTKKQGLPTTVRTSTATSSDSKHSKQQQLHQNHHSREQQSKLQNNQYFNHHRNHEPKDDTYTHKIAQRSVARAALHLGMESMTQDTLHVLSDALICYMEKIGSFISHFVEKDGGISIIGSDGGGVSTTSTSTSSSKKSYANSKKSSPKSMKIGNRWSGHVNVLDVLHAIECCTSHTVNQIDINEEKLSGKTSSSNNSNNSNSNAHMNNIINLNNGWEGLAEFLFGKDWLSIDLDGNYNKNEKGNINTTTNDNSQQSSSTATSAPDLTSNTNGRTVGSKSIGKTLISNTITSSTPSLTSSIDKLNDGKQLPSIIDQNSTTNGNDSGTNEYYKGWNAPYPDEVPMYPLRKSIKSLDTLVNSNQACRDPFPLYHQNRIIKTKQEVGKDSTNNNNDNEGINTDPSLLTSTIYDQHQLDIAERIGTIPHCVFQDGLTTFWGETIYSTTDARIVNDGKEPQYQQEDVTMKDATNQSSKGDETKSGTGPDDSTKNTSTSNKRKRDDEMDELSLTLTKRTKFGTIFAGDENHSTKLPSFVPKFFPPFPPSHTFQRSSSKSSTVNASVNRRSESQYREVESSSISMDQPSSSSSKPDVTSQTTNVRSALVSLGREVRKTYWGVMVDNQHESTSRERSLLKSIQLKTTKIENLNTSTLGDATNIGNTVASAQEMSSKGGGGSGGVVPVKPMSKASSVRTSRILEGSMDTSV